MNAVTNFAFEGKPCFYSTSVEEAFKTATTEVVFAVHCDGQHVVVSFADDDNPPPGVLVGFVKKP